MYLQNYPYILRTVLIVCYLAVMILPSCNKNSKKKPDVSDVDIHFRAIPFYQELFALDTANLEAGINELGTKYPDFTAVFFKEMTGFASTKDQTVFYHSVRHFLTYKDFRNLLDTVNKKFPDTKKIDQELKVLFQHIKYYFPEEKWGTVYYFISGLNQWSAVTIDTLLGIGLDMHLGKNYPFYASVQVPEYQIQNCEPEFIRINAAKAIFEDKFSTEARDKNLLQLMLQKGMQMTFAEYCLPDVPDEMLMGYTPAQLKWCRQNEEMIWSYFKKQNLLYSNNWQQILRYVNEGPTSTGMPPESPGNIGTWIGWQIVRKYLEEHPEVKWNELMKQPIDATAFLRDSKYKPR